MCASNDSFYVRTHLEFKGIVILSVVGVDNFLRRGSKTLGLRTWLRMQHTFPAASAGYSRCVSRICHRRSVLGSSTYQWHSLPDKFSLPSSCDADLKANITVGDKFDKFLMTFVFYYVKSKINWTFSG